MSLSGSYSKFFSLWDRVTLNLTLGYLQNISHTEQATFDILGDDKTEKKTQDSSFTIEKPGKSFKKLQPVNVWYFSLKNDSDESLIIKTIYCFFYSQTQTCSTVHVRYS